VVVTVGVMAFPGIDFVGIFCRVKLESQVPPPGVDFMNQFRP
jgi:hypothetical protein